MTCASYLKLPPYSCVEVLRERLEYAITEGVGSFDLSEMTRRRRLARDGRASNVSSIRVCIDYFFRRVTFAHEACVAPGSTVSLQPLVRLRSPSPHLWLCPNLCFSREVSGSITGAEVAISESGFTGLRVKGVHPRSRHANSYSSAS